MISCVESDRRTWSILRIPRNCGGFVFLPASRAKLRGAPVPKCLWFMTHDGCSLRRTRGRGSGGPPSGSKGGFSTEIQNTRSVAPSKCFCFGLVHFVDFPFRGHMNEQRHLYRKDAGTEMVAPPVVLLAASDGTVSFHYCGDPQIVASVGNNVESLPRLETKVIMICLRRNVHQNDQGHQV